MLQGNTKVVKIFSPKWNLPSTTKMNLLTYTQRSYKCYEITRIFFHLMKKITDFFPLFFQVTSKTHCKVILSCGVSSQEKEKAKVFLSPYIVTKIRLWRNIEGRKEEFFVKHHKTYKTHKTQNQNTKHKIKGKSGEM